MPPPLTPELVHVKVVPPADPDTDPVPLQDAPVDGLVISLVNVPENALTVVVPVMVPSIGIVPPVVCQRPKTPARSCVRFSVTGCAAGPAAAVVNDSVPDQAPATFAAVGAIVEPPPQETRGSTAANADAIRTQVCMVPVPSS